MNIQKLQELLNRTNGVEDIHLLGKDNVEEYREILKDAMRYKFIKRKVHGFDEGARVKWHFFTLDVTANLDGCIDQAIKDE